MEQRRTDLALEAAQLWREGGNTGELPGVTQEESTREGYPVTTVKVLDDRGAKAIGKPVKRQTIDELGTLGIVKMIKVGLGEVTGFEDLTIDSYVEYTPDPKRHEDYTALYERFIATRDSLAPYWTRH